MNKQYHLIATCTFGLESVVKDEVKKLGYEIDKVENGKIHYRADRIGIIKSNLWLRCAGRVLVVVGEFKAYTFDELFDKTTDLPFEDFIPVDASFPVSKVKSAKAKLFSLSDTQRIVKKAIVKRLMSAYNTNVLNETGATYSVYVFNNKDNIIMALDTSGSGLTRRGYREVGNKAPIKETLAAGLVYLSKWTPDRILADPLCGSGTILIEAAMIGRNMAPGLNRTFASENWHIFKKNEWIDERGNAEDMINDLEFMLYGSDVDYFSIKQAEENAELAEVEDFITFQKKDVKDFSNAKPYGVIISNPPYGERLETEASVKKLYGVMGETFTKLQDWSCFVITANQNFEEYFGKKATKNRKLYNGNLLTYFYQYFGKLPRRGK